jgi:hypothetical protein
MLVSIGAWRKSSHKVLLLLLATNKKSMMARFLFDCDVLNALLAVVKSPRIYSFSSHKGRLASVRARFVLLI